MLRPALAILNMIGLNHHLLQHGLLKLVKAAISLGTNNTSKTQQDPGKVLLKGVLTIFSTNRQLLPQQES